MSSPRFPLTISVLIACVSIAAANAEDEVGGYLFFGSDVSAESGKSHFPIVTMDKKNIYVDAGVDVKKVSHRASVRTRPELVLAETFADVLEIHFTTSSMANMQRAAQAVSDMHYAQFQTEVEVAMLNAQAEGDLSSGEDLSPADRALVGEIQDVEQDNADFQTAMQDSLDTGAFELDELADSIHVNCTLIPEKDIQGAYCVIVVSHNTMDMDTGEMLGRARFARAKYIGDLLADELVGLRLRVAVGEFNKEEAEFEFHLFTQDGEQVALSSSRGLKPLTPQEVATFKELSEKTSLRNRG